MQVQGNAFLVSGGASGLGEACVRHLAALGAQVVAADVNAAAGEKLAAELGEAVCFVPTDVTDSEQVQAALDAPSKPLAGVVNCAGILHAARVLGREGPYDLEAFARVVRVNLVGTFNMVRLAAAAMSGNEPNQEGERGVIVNTASIAAYEGQIGQASYAASKAGVAGMTLPIARELARFGIRVMAIAPGMFDTPMMAAMTDEVRQSLEAQVPFPPRLGRPHEFALLVQHILENPMLNGSVIRLDGAARLGPK